MKSLLIGLLLVLQMSKVFGQCNSTNVEIVLANSPTQYQGNGTYDFTARLCFAKKQTCSNKFRIRFEVPDFVERLDLNTSSTSELVISSMNLASPVPPVNKKYYYFVFESKVDFTEPFKRTNIDFRFRLGLPRTCEDGNFEIKAEMVYLEESNSAVVIENSTCTTSTAASSTVAVVLPDKITFYGISFSPLQTYSATNNLTPIYFDIVINKGVSQPSMFSSVNFSVDLGSVAFDVLKVTELENKDYDSWYTSTFSRRVIVTNPTLTNNKVFSFSDNGINSTNNLLQGYRVFLKLKNFTQSSVVVNPTVTVTPVSSCSNITLPTASSTISNSATYQFALNSQISDQPFIVNHSPSTCINVCQTSDVIYEGQVDNNSGISGSFASSQIDIPIPSGMNLKTLNMSTSLWNSPALINPANVSISYKVCGVVGFNPLPGSLNASTEYNFETSSLNQIKIEVLRLTYSSFPSNSVSNFQIKYEESSSKVCSSNNPYTVTPLFSSGSANVSKLSNVTFNNERQNCTALTIYSFGFGIPDSPTDVVFVKGNVLKNGDDFYSMYLFLNNGNSSINFAQGNLDLVVGGLSGNNASIHDSRQVLFYYGTSFYPKINEFNSISNFITQPNSAPFTNMALDLANISQNKLALSNFSLPSTCLDIRYFIVLIKSKISDKARAITYNHNALTSISYSNGHQNWRVISSGPPNLKTRGTIGCSTSGIDFQAGTLKPNDTFFYFFDVVNTTNMDYKDVKILATLPSVNDLELGSKNANSRGSTITISPKCSNIKIQTIDKEGIVTNLTSTQYSLYFLNNSNNSIQAFPTSSPSGEACGVSASQAIYLVVNQILAGYSTLRMAVEATVPANSLNLEGKSNFLSDGTLSSSSVPLVVEPSQVTSFTVAARSTCDPITFNCTECVPSFSPEPGQKYVLSAWVKEGYVGNGPATYTNAGVQITFNEGTSTLPVFKPSGPIIDGWQRVEQSFTVPSDAVNIQVKLVNNATNATNGTNSANGTDAYFDDIRIHPFRSNMKSFVYDPSTQRLIAELDENNYATKYEYDDEGILIRVKKETERGVMTIKESRNNQSKINLGN